MLSLTRVQISASHNTVKLDVPLYGQEKREWCWIASARMVGRYFYSTSRTQTDGVRHVKGHTRDESGTTVETRDAARYFTHNRNRFYATGAFSFAEVRTNIDKSWPVIAGIRYRSGAGHMVVFYGYTVGPRNPGGVYYNDPSQGGRRDYVRFIEIENGSHFGGSYIQSVY